MKILESMNQEESKKLLSEIKMYSDMTKKLGRRGRILFQKILTGKQSFLVEYFPAFGEDGAWEQAKNVYKKSFSLSPERSDVVFVPRESLKWGMKVYVDDSMVDVSFTKVEKLLQK